jgi:hypothetical protein
MHGSPLKIEENKKNLVDINILEHLMQQSVDDSKSESFDHLAQAIRNSVENLNEGSEKTIMNLFS